MAMKDNVTAICIGSDGCGLSNAQPIELGFAKIGVHPHPSKRYDGHQWRASRDLLTDLDSPLGDDACDRCNDMHMTAPDRRATVIGDGRQPRRVGGNDGALPLCVHRLILALTPDQT